MSLVKDAIKTMREMVLLNDKVERTANQASSLSKELREHEIRLVKLETIVDIARIQSSNNKRLEENN